MLTSLVLTLTPGKDTALTIHSGRLLHGAFLNFIREHDPGLSERLHDPEEDKPFTVSFLRGPFERKEGALVAVGGRTYRARVTMLEVALSALVHEHLTPGAVLQIGEAGFEVQAVARSGEEDPWAAVSSYKDLYNGLLDVIADPPFKTTLTFESPTTFRSDGANLPLPVPRFVFRNYYEKWNRYAPIFLGEDLGEAIERSVWLTRYETKTQIGRSGL